MRELLFATRKEPTDSASAAGGELGRIVLATGEIRSTGLSLRGLGHARLSLDGRRVALLVQSFASELWVMDPPNFDSARSIKADQK